MANTISVKNVNFADKNYRLTNEERETIITFNETHEPATIMTYNPSLIRKLDGWYEEGIEGIELVEAESLNGTQYRKYRFPKKWAKINKPKVLSEETLEILRKTGRENAKYLRSE